MYSTEYPHVTSQWFDVGLKVASRRARHRIEVQKSVIAAEKDYVECHTV